jgi:anthranilate synthase component 2
MKILIFDNYDSFTYNLVHLVEKITHEKVDVFRNDEITLEKVKEYDKVILSPGPGLPEEAGNLVPLVKEYASSRSILGVCLGHQAIGQAFGGTLVNLNQVYHGIALPVQLVGGHQPLSYLFEGLPDGMDAGRYHSWVVSEENFPGELEVTARDKQGHIMAMQHKVYDVQGLQFHPESILTPMGEQIMKNWIKH